MVFTTQTWLLALSLVSPLVHAAPNPMPRGIKPRQDAAAADVFPNPTAGPVVLDLPSGNPAGPPSASGQAYAATNLARPDGNPVDTQDNTYIANPPLVPGQDAPTDDGLILDFQDVVSPQPIRGTTGKTGGTNPGPPDTSRYDRMNSDVYASPGTDSGDLPQLAWPMGLSHNRLGLSGAGFARQQNIEQLPAALQMSGVDMRLSPNAYRELHWHSASEWAYVLNGTVRIQAVNENGETYVDDLNAGDLWFFPAGVPHSLQAFETGVEFLLVFDNGAFSDDGTSLVSEMFLRNPLEVMAKDLQTSIAALSDIPQDQLYIFPGTPAPKNISEQNVTGPAGFTKAPDTQYTYHFSQQPPMSIPGAGSLKIADATVFPAAADIACALVTIEPGAMRELHWHLQSDEWNFFISGTARITVYSPPDSSRTFDYGPGDVGYIPQTFSHYIENTGDEPVVVLEMLRAPKFTDISASQWLGLTPRQIVKDTLHLPDSVLDNLPKYKPYIVPGNPNHTVTNFTRPF